MPPSVLPGLRFRGPDLPPREQDAGGPSARWRAQQIAARKAQKQSIHCRVPATQVQIAVHVYIGDESFLGNLASSGLSK